VPENVSIAYRGANYAIGQGPQFYGIWHAAAPQSAPLEWWPLTPEGWTAAWSRFASIEVPGTIGPVTGVPTTPPDAAAAAGPQVAAATDAAGVQPGDPQDDDQEAGDPDLDPQYGQVIARPAAAVSSPRMALISRIGAALIAVGVVLGVIGIFPAYDDGASLASQSADLVPHLFYLAAWAVSAALILFSGTRRQVGALLGAGVSAVTLGLFIADVGTPVADGSQFFGAGLVLSLIGWLACAAGCGLACAESAQAVRARAADRRKSGRRPGRIASHEIVPTVVMILAAIGAAIAFAPAWDSFLLRISTGASQKVTLGNAFANPGLVIFGDVATMVLLVAAVAIAALWRPMRFGAALAAGAIIPMVAQGVSAIVEVYQPTSPLQFGYSQAQANSIGLTITNGLTPMFWVFCAFVGTLILLCVWMLLAGDSAADHPGYPYPGQPYPGQPYPGAFYPGQSHQGQPYGGQPHPGQSGGPQPYPGQQNTGGTTVQADAAPPAAGGSGVPSHPAPQP
jgi:hypothetical protein